MTAPTLPGPTRRAGEIASAAPAVAAVPAAPAAGRRASSVRQPMLPLPARRPVPQAARDLLADAGRGLGRAIRAVEPTDRYAIAHLAALRGAAALLAAKARPGGRGNQGNAWVLLARLAPEFDEWSAFFAAGSAKRQAADAGITRLVSRPRGRRHGAADVRRSWT